MGLYSLDPSLGKFIDHQGFPGRYGDEVRRCQDNTDGSGGIDNGLFLLLLFHIGHIDDHQGLTVFAFDTGTLLFIQRRADILGIHTQLFNQIADLIRCGTYCRYPAAFAVFRQFSHAVFQCFIEFDHCDSSSIPEKPPGSPGCILHLYPATSRVCTHL